MAENVAVTKTTGVPAPGLAKPAAKPNETFRLINRNDFKVTGRVDNIPYAVHPGKFVDFDTLAQARKVRDSLKADGGGELSFATKDEIDTEKEEVARLEAAKEAAAQLESAKQKALAKANAEIEAARLAAEKVEADFEQKKAEAEQKVAEDKEK